MQFESENLKNDKFIICLWCGQPAQIIWVHGHGQCSICRTNIEECCRGEQCSSNQDTHNLTSTENN